MSDWKYSGLSRRELLARSAVAGLAVPAIVTGAFAQSTFNWKQAAGTSIDVMLAKTPRGDVIQADEAEFTALTGIKVSSEQIPEQQQRQKALIEFTSGRPSFDVVGLALHVQKRQSAKGNWLSDLRPMVADASITSPEFLMSDFGKGGIDFATQADGTMNTIPMNLDFWVVFYNKELFAAKGLEYPKTMDEMMATAAKLHDPAKGIAGFVGRGLKNANVPVWTSWLLGQGIDTVDKNGNLQTDGAEAIWAAEFYKKLLRDYAPQGSIGFNWNECQTTFMQGRAAMWLDGIGFAAPLEDKTKSRVVGKVGYGVTPAGPKAQHSALFADGLGIAAQSKKKVAAWLYIQWALNKQHQLRFLQTGAGAPSRISPYRDKETVANSPFGGQYFETLVKSAEIARAGLPEIIPVTEFRDTFGVALTNMIGGADAATELKKATEAFKPVLEKSEKG